MVLFIFDITFGDTKKCMPIIVVHIICDWTRDTAPYGRDVATVWPSLECSEIFLWVNDVLVT
jgi:hypothetical protein